MSQLVLRGVWSRALKHVTLACGPGLHVVLGSSADGAEELIELAAGVASPRRGGVWLEDREPSKTPDLRRRIGSLLGAENLTGTGAVGAWLEELRELRRGDLAASLARYAPHVSRERPLASLSATERRALALAVALADPEPLSLALYDPESALVAPVRDAGLERVRELAQRAIVLVAVPSVTAARRLAGTLHVLDRGVLSRSPSHAWPNALTPGLGAWLLVECERPRELLAALAQCPEVEEARYDAGRAAKHVRVRGGDIEGLSLAVSGAAVRSRAGVHALRVAAPDLETVHGASLGLADAAYRAARAPRPSLLPPDPEPPAPESRT